MSPIVNRLKPVSAAAQFPRPMAYVLGTGASHGAVQVGHLRALWEAGLRPDLVVGCSVGALNGAVLAADPDDAAVRLAAIWRSLRRRDVFPFPSGPLRRRRTLLSPAGILGAIDRFLTPGTTFDEFTVPLHVVAIPGVFPAVTIDGVRLVDGGIPCSLPIAEAFALGAASVVALPTTHWPALRVRLRRGSVASREGSTLLLGGTVSPGHGWFGTGFARTAELIERGHLAARRQLTPTVDGEARQRGGLSRRTVRICRRCARLCP